ncbi:MAG: DUF1697 domain-containing protein [Ilumatobacter sp.]|uniref:DUF1697 domain-containing protein n=1 Tax=Ilumatobacter sp. TaxID=1967498 RepID=UPI002619A1C6|nr:DUF1697 domain-containing protein [Ilumatobacter sp.]MDJ0770569.1 DUF1697 domain-containing protein [Ilumatobacter sp.]
MSTRWVALLRGINVGGANKLSMADLRATLAMLGFDDVVTYIQSGNAIFDAGADADENALGASIAGALDTEHGLAVPVVVRPADDLARIARSHPDAGRGIDPKLLHVLFLDSMPTTGATAALDPARFEPDGWTVDGREIYVRYPDGSGRSKLTIEVFERSLDVTATARNLNTVRKLVDLADR